MSIMDCELADWGIPIQKGKAVIFLADVSDKTQDFAGVLDQDGSLNAISALPKMPPQIYGHDLRSLNKLIRFRFGDHTAYRSTYHDMTSANPSAAVSLSRSARSLATPRSVAHASYTDTTVSVSPAARAFM